MPNEGEADAAATFSIDVPRRIVRVTYRALPSYREFVVLMDQIFGDPQYDPSYGILLDRRAIQEAADSEFVRNICHVMDSRKATRGPSRWALLVSDMVSFGMGRMAEQLSEHQHFFRPFQDLKEAEAWLTQAK